MSLTGCDKRVKMCVNTVKHYHATCDSKTAWYTATRRMYYCRLHVYHGLSEIRVISCLAALCVECRPSKHSLGQPQYIFLQFQFTASHHRSLWWPLERV